MESHINAYIQVITFVFYCFIETYNVRNGWRYRLCSSQSINHENMYWKLKGTTPLIKTFIFFYSKEYVQRKEVLQYYKRQIKSFRTKMLIYRLRKYKTVCNHACNFFTLHLKCTTTEHVYSSNCFQNTLVYGILKYNPGYFILM